jgi:ribosomal protein S21
MPGRIVLREGESIEDALGRLRQVVRQASRRQWSKTRPGVYEKPSVRKRRKESTRLRNARRTGAQRQGYTTVYLELRPLLSRYEPFLDRNQTRRQLQRGERRVREFGVS